VTNLSELLPSGGGAKEFSAVASGTLTNGQTVSLLSNGKVEASGVESVTASVGSVNSLGVNGTRATIAGYYDPDENACVIIYSGLNDYMTAVAGTISGTTITFGSPSIGYSFQTSSYCAAYDTTNNAAVVVYYSDGNTGNVEAKQLNVSGTTSNWETGNGTQVHTSSSRPTSIVFCPNSDRFLATWNQSSQGLLRHCIGQISGTSTSWTSYVDNFNGQFMNCYDGAGGRPVLSYDPTYEVVLIAQSYRYSPHYMSYMVVSVGSSSASATINQTALNSYYSDIPFSAYNANDKKHVLTYGATGGMDVVPIQFTSNSAVSFTTPTVSSGNFGPTIGNSNVRDANGIGYNALTKKTGLMYSDNLGVQYIVSVDTSTSTYTTGTNLLVQNTQISSKQERPVLYDSSSTNMFIAFKTASTTYAARTYTMDADISNASSFIGITSEAIANTATGKVNPQGGVATSSTPGAGSASASTQYDATGVEYNGIAYDTNANRFLIAFADVSNSNYGTAVVGNISGGTLSYGSPEVFENTGIQTPMLAFDSNANKVAIFYRNSSGYGSARVATIDPSNDTVTFGTVKIFTTSNISMQDNTSSAVFVPSTPTTAAANKVVVGFMDSSNSQIGKAIVGTITGTDIAFPLGGGTTFHNARTAAITLAYDSTAKRICIGYKDRDDGNKGKALVATVSGTGLSFGADAIFEDGIASKTGSAFDPDTNKVIISYQDNGDNNYAKAVVGTIASTSISFGTPATVLEATSNETSVVYDTNLKKVVVSVDDGGGTRGIAFTGTVSGTDISFDSGVVFETNQISWLNSAFDPDNNKVAIVYDISAGKGVVLSPAGAPSNLVTGSTYYVQNDGTLTTTSSTVTAGKAISTTQLVLKGAS